MARQFWGELGMEQISWLVDREIIVARGTRKQAPWLEDEEQAQAPWLLAEH